VSNKLEEHMIRLRADLRNMLAILAANRELLHIERGSPDDKEIVAARKTMIETMPEGENYDPH
jgi:hypothetical protein